MKKEGGEKGAEMRKKGMSEEWNGKKKKRGRMADGLKEEGGEKGAEMRK